jgi:hypothetical protein
MTRSESTVRGSSKRTSTLSADSLHRNVRASLLCYSVDRRTSDRIKVCLFKTSSSLYQLGFMKFVVNNMVCTLQAVLLR